MRATAFHTRRPPDLHTITKCARTLPHAPRAADRRRPDPLIFVLGCGVMVGRDTPLHVAAYNGSVEIVRLLLIAEAPLDVMNGNGRTPDSLARQDGGGRPAEKAATTALLQGWQCAVPGSPVLVGTVVNEHSDFYYFDGPNGAYAAAGRRLHADEAPLPPPLSV